MEKAKRFTLRLLIFFAGLVVLSVAITLLFSHRIANIGIGTILSMLVTGRIVKLISVPTAKLYEKVS